MTRFAVRERQALCDTLAVVGPEAPTLCSPWRACDLAAHLALRDTRLDLMLGQWVPPLRGRLDSAMRERARQPFPELVAAVRNGPPRWSPVSFGPLNETTNMVEMFVHHEDVRRAAEPWTARALDPEFEAALWASLGRAAKFLYRRADVGVVLDAGEAGQVQAHAEGPSGSVVVTGAVSELLLYSYGRRAAAQVSVSGPDEATASLAATELSI